MKKHSMKLLCFTIIALYSSNTLAWKCGQKCPTSIFSGKLECEAYEKGCSSARNQVIKNNVCVYNETERNLKLTIDWQKCEDIIGELPSKEYKIYTCDATQEEPALILEWIPNQKESFRFKDIEHEEKCSEKNTLMLYETSFGKVWNIHIPERTNTSQN